jgi:hypothetical protein
MTAVIYCSFNALPVAKKWMAAVQHNAKLFLISP